MAPTYQEGDYVLVANFSALIRWLNKGDVVVFNHPEYGLMIKAVGEVNPVQGTFTVLGTHPDSVDSRRFGPVQKEQLAGKVIWHIRKPRVVS